VRGFLHLPARSNGDSLALTHGAGANCKSKLMLAVSTAFADAGFAVLRYDLPFRQVHPFGPPFPNMAERDRAGVRRAIEFLKSKTSGRIVAGGHSYGGRQTSMLIAEHPELVAGLVLLSYPLHPPRKPEQLRTAHFPELKAPALFVHGARDPFASFEEMQSALKLIPAPHQLLEVESAGHELRLKKGVSELPQQIVMTFQDFFRNPSRL